MKKIVSVAPWRSETKVRVRDRVRVRVRIERFENFDLSAFYEFLHLEVMRLMVDWH